MGNIDEQGSLAGPSHPQLYRSEDGGYIVDPSTVSSSPIRTFTRISDLSPSKKAGFLGQFDYSKKRKGSRPTGVRGRSGLDFDELASGWYTVACIAKNCVYLREGGREGMEGGRKEGRKGKEGRDNYLE